MLLHLRRLLMQLRSSLFWLLANSYRWRLRATLLNRSPDPSSATARSSAISSTWRPPPCRKSLLRCRHHWTHDAIWPVPDDKGFFFLHHHWFWLFNYNCKSNAATYYR